VANCADEQGLAVDPQFNHVVVFVSTNFPLLADKSIAVELASAAIGSGAPNALAVPRAIR
jgi:hypothetical protein